MTRPLRSIFVTVGTDHHRFDRLIRSVERWLENGGAGRAQVFCQHGSSAAPRGMRSQPFLSAGQMAEAMREADVVVCHAGPGAIFDARRAGIVPIVVPRLRSLGEVVDNHQVPFAERLATLGEVHMARSEAELQGLLDLVSEEPTRFRAPFDDTRSQEAVRRIEQILGSGVEPRVRTLYIGGVGRSGTTLLARLLAEVPGFVSVGELVHIWRRSVLGNQRCGCGQPFLDCEVWGEIGERAFGGWRSVDAKAILALQRRVERHRYAPFLAAPGLSARFRADLTAFGRILDPLYAAIRDVTRADVIVDSSKHSPYAYVLRQVPGVDLRVVHMLRDPRGVAYSWTKRVQRPEIVDGVAYMDTVPPAKLATRWAAHNVFFDALKLLGVPLSRLRYESLLERPRAELERILRFAGRRASAEDLSFLGENGARLGVDHSVSGNPMRFTAGEVPLRLDEEWRRAMSASDRFTVQAMTFPLRARYGYL